MKRTGVAFAVIAIATFAIQIERVLFDIGAVEFAYMAVLLVCWMAVVYGARGVVRYRKEFAGAYRAAMIAVVCVLAGAALAFTDWMKGAGIQSFLSVGVMFMMYTQMMAQLYSYSKMLNGASELCRKARYQRKGNVCRVIWKPCVLVIILSMFAVELAKLFDGQTGYIIAGVAAALGLIAHFLMVRMILSVHDTLDGRALGHRRAQPKTTGKNGSKPKTVKKAAVKTKY